ncbi:glycoside hydrolase family 5 protein, partial [Fistulina hepatica ATCC 64428]
LEDGSTFIYINPFGGQWYWDENDPFNNGAQAQSYTPALNETFKFGEDRIYGVNLGGWLVTEPFIAPALYEPYENDTNYVVDEWTLCERLKSDGKLNILEQHYSTFITEKDFAEIAAAGLNWVRIPLGWWAIETRDTEPFIANTSWTYFLKAIQWARKYGIRINLDLHAIPGSQNGWNHSGRLGSINFLNGPMGFANAQRALDYIRILAEFVSQPQYSSVVAMFGILNEPVVSTFGQSQLSAFYLQAYDVVRKASGTGEGKGPFISFHNGFLDLTEWSGVYPNADRIALDSHPYIAFGGQSDAAMSTYATTPCTAWGASFNTSMANFGLTTAGEFSNAVTDCGKYLNGVNLGVRYEGTYTGGTYERVGSCDPWVDYENYSTDMKESIRTFAMASMDALQNWFFWAWKIGNSSVTGKVPSPAWSYQLGLQHGWMPTDPRSAMGQCKNTDPWTPPLQAWQTGGSGAGDIPASVTNSLVWPPATVSNAGAVTLLPSYTPTGTVPTLSPPKFSFSAATATPSVGNGWMNSADTAGMMVNIPACRYLDPWVGPASDPPSPLC